MVLVPGGSHALRPFSELHQANTSLAHSFNDFTTSPHPEPNLLLPSLPLLKMPLIIVNFAQPTPPEWAYKNEYLGQLEVKVQLNEPVVASWAQCNIQAVRRSNGAAAAANQYALADVVPDSQRSVIGEYDSSDTCTLVFRFTNLWLPEAGEYHYDVQLLVTPPDKPTINHDCLIPWGGLYHSSIISIYNK